jgi:DNA-binding MarR family transcriptional regulator
VRQAARRITQFYDRYLVAAGLRTTQYGILAKLKRRGAMTINTLAAELANLSWIVQRLAAISVPSNATA